MYLAKPILVRRSLDHGRIEYFDLVRESRSWRVRSVTAIEMVCGLLHFLGIGINGKITAASLCDEQKDLGRRR